MIQLPINFYTLPQKKNNNNSVSELFDEICNFEFNENGKRSKTIVEETFTGDLRVTKFINEFWTSQQRQANALHEISYRACFKPQLPRFFISKFSSSEDIVYDPFSGRGTTIIEANLNSRIGIANDINPLSEILAKPRLFPPTIADIKKRLMKIQFDEYKTADIDLSMFYHSKTESEIVSLKHYLLEKTQTQTNDYIDNWIRMVATNRLTGHSKGFFSVYSLPPNQALSQESQRKINIKLNQLPEYRDTKEIILKKSSSLLKDLDSATRSILDTNSSKNTFLTKDARYTNEILDNSTQLTVTSPPFLNVVQYDQDNWLRSWFNSLDSIEIAQKITILSSLDRWIEFMQGVFDELFRITKPGGWVAFEVGEVNKGKIFLDEYIAPIGLKSGFNLFGILINQQTFTKTSNIWGVENNELGTNSNRIVIFYKGND